METLVAVWWADLTAADLTLEASLPGAERARLDGLTGADRARRAVGAALLQRAVRAHRGEVDPGAADIVIDHTCDECGRQHGRPVVEGGPFVSVAHAGVLVLVATCGMSPVGVDVEREARFEGDAQAAQAVPGANAAQAWVRREARLKAGVQEDRPDDARKDRPTDAPTDVHLLPLETPLPGYVAAVAVAPVAVAAGGTAVPVVVRTSHTG